MLVFKLYVLVSYDKERLCLGMCYGSVEMKEALC